MRMSREWRMPVNAMKGPTMTVIMEPSPVIVPPIVSMESDTATMIIPQPPILGQWVRFKSFLKTLWLEMRDWFDI